MFANKEVAARHLPIAHGRDGKADQVREHAQTDARHLSETRLQAAVVADRKRDDVDPYADVPCTD